MVLSEASIACGSAGDLAAVLPQYERDFPEEERKSSRRLAALLERGDYSLLLLRDASELLGYAFVCQCHRALWLDYIAISPHFRGLGFGSFFFQELLQLREDLDGVFLEVEPATGKETALKRQRQKRIAFYERLGAVRLGFPYFFPTQTGGFPLHLYFKPQDRLTALSKPCLKRTVESVFNLVHRDLACCGEVLARNLAAIEEQFGGPVDSHLIPLSGGTKR